MTNNGWYAIKIKPTISSNGANTLGKGMNPVILFLAMGK